ncbi:MAG TPA: hypothetical protein VJI52_00450 [Candidatus Nanoarchaeia archaeon]|nr:hypothetical protein [Candidatus Nanoarchaeia archaeon]
MKKRAVCCRLFSFRKSQANEVYHVLIQAAIALAVYLTMQAYIDSVSKDTLFEKVYLSKDSGLLMDTVYGSPGELTYEYKNDLVGLNRFKFSFKNQRASIDEAESKSKLTAEQPYGEDMNAPYSGNDISNSDKIVFSKTKTGLSTGKG